jgi:sucrose-6-phosphate hydrolase SacC (GH32 family)
MSLPRELALAQTAEGWRLLQSPVSTQALRGEPRHLAGAGVVDSAGDVLELRWELHSGEADASTLDVRCGPADESTRIGIDHRRGIVWIDRSLSGQVPSAAHWQGRREQPWAGASGPLVLRVIVDRCSVEVFSGDGLVALTEVVYPGEASLDVAVLKQGSGDWLRSVLTLWTLS